MIEILFKINNQNELIINNADDILNKKEIIELLNKRILFKPNTEETRYLINELLKKEIIWKS